MIQRSKTTLAEGRKAWRLQPDLLRAASSPGRPGLQVDRHLPRIRSSLRLEDEVAGQLRGVRHAEFDIRLRRLGLSKELRALLGVFQVLGAVRPVHDEDAEVVPVLLADGARDLVAAKRDELEHHGVPRAYFM